jgi:hypothetical protein
MIWITQWTVERVCKRTIHFTIYWKCSYSYTREKRQRDKSSFKKIHWPLVYTSILVIILIIVGSYCFFQEIEKELQK